MTETTQNVDQHEIGKFEELAARWWDPNSEFKPLHDINPLRLDYIDQAAGLSGKEVLDVGCGGGILSESMAVRGAKVTGIDMGAMPLRVAELHTLEIWRRGNLPPGPGGDPGRGDARHSST